MGIAPCTVLSCTHHSHPIPWVLGEVSLTMCWLIQAGCKVLPGPHSIDGISFPLSRCFLGFTPGRA